MRKNFYLITEHPDEDVVGNVEMTGHRHVRVEKNDEGVVDTRNIETGEETTYRCVGLGYHDFEDEQDYEENAPDIVQEKLAEIDAKWHEKAGIESEVSA